MSSFFHVEQTFQNVTSVVVVHKFHVLPHVTVVDQTGNVILPDTIQHDAKREQLTVTFGAPQSGTIVASI